MKKWAENFRRAIWLMSAGSLLGASVAGAIIKSEVSITPYVKKRGIEDSSSFCYVHRDRDSIQGQNIRSKVKIASVSKLFTSYYALKTRGPQFRFQTRFYFDPATKDLTVIGSRDPFMGHKALQFISSELNRVGITEVRTFSFDQGFSVYLDVERAGAAMWSDAKMHGEVRYRGRGQQGTLADLKRFFQPPARKGQVKKTALKIEAFVPLQGPVQRDRTHLAFEYVSAPLLNYVKNLNVHSNNYVADEMIAAFGGINKLVRFYKIDLGFTDEDFEFYTGSGLWKNLPEIPGSEKVRTENAKDNLATCESVMNVLFAIERFAKKTGLQMSDVVMVASEDRGSLTGSKAYRSEELRDSVIAKTGTLNQAATLAGEISSKEGDFYFGIFFETTNRSATNKATVYRDQLIRQLMKDVGEGKEPIKYTPTVFSPFDKNSVLRKLEENDFRPG